MGSRVEQFELIRRDHARGMAVRALARRHGVHRRTVRQAIEAATPPPRKIPERRPAPALGPYRALIDSWLEADLTAPPKQRHSAVRIWQRLVAEHGVGVAESTVRDYVRARRRQIGLPGQAYVPQAHLPGAEGECDWGEALVKLGSVLIKVGLFHLRSCHAGGAFIDVYPRMTQQAFLEGHADAFDLFGGVFARMRYDNLTSAVAKVLKGRRRIESDRFVAMRSHYGFESQFTLVGIAGAHEKGGVESEVGRFRRRHLVPVPQVGSFAELRAHVRAGMLADLDRRVAGRGQTVGQALESERALLLPLPPAPHQVHESLAPRVDAKALISVRASRYSVPVGLVGLRVGVQLGARELVVSHQGREVARHERRYQRGGMSAQLDHYLDVLRVKPGALAGSVALAQERQRGDWPGVLDQLWRQIAARYGESEAARQMVQVLLLAREVGPGRMVEAASGALAAGAHDARAVALLARMSPRAAAPALTDLPERLAATDRPQPDLDQYDALLAGRDRS